MGNRVAKGRAICGYGPVSSPARDEEEAALTLLRRDEVARVRLFSAVLVVHAIVWSTALALRPGLVPPRQIAAEILSTTAIVLISLNLVLATRARFVERGLRGLDKLFVTHRTIGLTVALVVTSHFLLVPKSVGWVPSKPVGYTLLPLLLLAVFVASAPRFPWGRLVPLKYQTWKLTHRFMGVFLILAVTHSLLAPTYVKRVPGLAIYVYGIALLGMSAWIYREALFRIINPAESHTVDGFRVLDGDVGEIVLSASNGTPRAAGQFACLTLESGPTREQHPFTISSAPEGPLRFSVKASGDFTKALVAGVPVGSRALVEGPYGAFDYRLGRRNQLWLAGGIGITPFLSMARELDDATAVRLVWSVRERHEAIYEDELAECAAARPNLTVDIHVTAERGRLDVSKLSLDAAPTEYSALVCGPVPMRKSLIEQLRALGVARSEIYFEEFRLR